MPTALDDKNETTRFLGEGVSFKAKLIGILEVSEARGDRMCQEALSDLKTAIRAAGEHKQRITINIAIDGLRLRDEKTGDSLYHHPVHKISFIAQDMTDSRAFGYIFGSPDTGHRFFGIKTDKAASQVVIAMRDLFQVVFALKKKEIELAKQHLDKTRYGTSPLFSDTSITSKISTAETSSKLTNSESKASSNAERSTPAVADLVDLELELSSLQQGLHQMERITPSDTYGTKDDPFGDSFIPFPPILPPPPSTGKDRASRTSESSSLFSPKTPHTTASIDTLGDSKDLNLPHDFSLNDEPSSGDWFTPPAGNSLFEEPALPVEATKPSDQHEKKKQEILSQFDVFTDLDPLGTGKSKPYIDKKHFFQELKNPPKKVLKDLVQEGQPKDPTAVFPANFDVVTAATPTTNSSNLSTSPNLFTSDPFGDDPFTKADPFVDGDPFDTDLFKDTKDFTEQFNFPRKVEKQMSVASATIRHVNFNKQNTFDAQLNKLTHLHENPSLDLSSESECAPEPPPRPATNVNQIKPPPLPPKKMQEICAKPPPRPPHSDEVHYDYMENFETAPNSLEYAKSNIEESPPLPVPQRKSKFENDFTTPPERPKKNFNLTSEEDDYLTPVSGPYPEKKSSVLLPPPQRSRKGSPSPSSIDTKPNITTALPSDKNSLEGLDMTLSQLTLTGLNDLAMKLDIPQAQLSNMTLVQLTQYLSNFIKNKAETKNEPEFQPDFANFNDFNRKSSETYDRYAVFRELLQEEIKQTKIDTEPEEITEKITVIHEEKITNKDEVVDKYAALREIVEIEIISSSVKEVSIEENENEQVEEVEEINGTTDENNLNEDDSKTEVDTENEVNKLNNELFTEDKENVSKVIEYHSPLDIKKDIIATTPTKSPIKSPLDKFRKSPIPEVIAEIVKSDARLTSGSLSDVISGSSPEIDNTASNSEKKKSADATGESWAIFDQPNSTQDLLKDKQNIQSEEGVSPWSSDSKEFGNSSPPEWRHPRIDSESGGEHWNRRRRDQEQGWWDTSAEPEVQYYPANRRSTDSYEDDCYDCYDRPRRRRQGGWPAHGAQATGGHSSSSRDVSPWEEEPSRRRDAREYREPRQMWSSKHGRQQSFDRHRDRRHNDSWDEEDDYEYEEEHRFHWQDRHGGRDPERERHGRDIDPERWGDDRNEEGRKHRRRRESERERWCCPDWDQSEAEKPRFSRYTEVPSAKWRERKHDERYYSRESQESPWEDEYSNDPDETHAPHYLSAPRRHWKQRPSSASEMDRKTGELKSRQGPYHLTTGGSDGERDRRYKPSRRSKSRESPFSDISHNRHKPDPGLTIRSRKHHHQKPHFDSEFSQEMKKSETTSVKKTSTLGRKKKDSPKMEEVNTFPRKGTARAQSLFENDFVPTETDSPESATLSRRFTFENDFETSGADSPIIKVRHEEKSVKLGLQRGRYHAKQRSLFEDDFSPTEKPEVPQEGLGISSIKEEGLHDAEEQDSFGRGSRRGNGIRKKILSKGRLSNNLHDGLKKSESVNIFVRENDPFDDDFFSGQDVSDLTPGDNGRERVSPRTSELKWNEQFEHFERK